mmetsp:Transcript_19745/g.29516  ORF Transcript_19745/g.29516 Transcript_19745/m.29516 type:complete len:98 (+) Transcript_19745:107-400(+)
MKCSHWLALLVHLSLTPTGLLVVFHMLASLDLTSDNFGVLKVRSISYIKNTMTMTNTATPTLPPQTGTMYCAYHLNSAQQYSRSFFVKPQHVDALSL